MSKKRKFSGNPLLNNLERSTRIELVLPTWKDGMLPLHQERFVYIYYTTFYYRMSIVILMSGTVTSIPVG